MNSQMPLYAADTSDAATQLRADPWATISILPFAPAQGIVPGELRAICRVPAFSVAYTARSYTLTVDPRLGLAAAGAGHSVL
jgi:hypothetical protein